MSACLCVCTVRERAGRIAASGGEETASMFLKKAKGSDEGTFQALCPQR